MKKYVLGSIVALMALLYACKKDFVVENIKDKTITVNAPADNVVTTTNQVTFWWEPLSGAEKYSLQVVQPSFSSITKIVLDTTTTNTKFSITLQPGTYQWRLRAANAGGNTAYQTFNLKVDTTSNLTSILVSNIAPVNNYLTGNTKVAFSWNTLNAATDYEIILLNSTNGIIKDTITALTSYTYTFPSSTTNYSWKVRAKNNFSISQYNTAYTFSIDVTAPAVSSPTAPTGIFPASGAMVQNTVSLGWSRIGAPDAKYDSVVVATDSLFTNIIGGTKTYSLSIPINALNNSSAITISSNYYFWRLYSKDSVRNVSGPSAFRKFKIIP
ncbi:MAG: hypothetical protein SFY56_11240 [Bacteroidota bacterium]|nr:hypothetical protein [Bacteroidota bacterium]